MPEGSRKTIVILGAGFGGLHCARGVAKEVKKHGLTDRYRVLLIDQNDYHTYTPTLYEVATTSEETANQLELKKIVTFPIKEGIGSLPIDFVKTKIIEIDVMNGDIHTETGTVIGFDYLVLALGSQTNYFNIPGLEEYSLPMKSFLDALHIREQLLLTADEEETSRLEIVIGGGGSTGVEVAGEVKLWLSHLKRRDVGISIVEGSLSVLSPFGKAIVLKAQKRLEKLGVAVWVNERIASVASGKVILASGKELPYDVLIWTGGVKPNQLMSTLHMKTDPSGSRVIATEGMTCLPERDDLKFYGSIYALGDGVCFIDPATDKPIPGVARAAISQANIVSNNLIQEILAAEKMVAVPNIQKYKPMNYPYVIPIGGKYAIAKIGPLIMTGFPAWLFKGFIELYYLSSVLPLHKALKTWIKGFFMFIKNDRLG